MIGVVEQFEEIGIDGRAPVPKAQGALVDDNPRVGCERELRGAGNGTGSNVGVFEGMSAATQCVYDRNVKATLPAWRFNPFDIVLPPKGADLPLSSLDSPLNCPHRFSTS